MSERPSTSGAALACSGLMYAGVPICTPDEVIHSFVAACVIARAIPKSATSTSLPRRRMFSGFTSRCTTSEECAYANATATSRAMRSASPIGSCRSRSSRARSVSPSTYDIAYHGARSNSPQSYSATMLGWCRRDRISISRRERSPLTEPVNSPRRSLMATLRSLRRSCATYTSPHPPRPISRSMRYASAMTSAKARESSPGTGTLFLLGGITTLRFAG